MKKFKFKGVKFLLFVVALFILLSIFDFENIPRIMDKFGIILYKIIPIFALVIVLTALINYFLKPKQVMKYFGKDSGKKGLIYALIGGVLSHGPMYAWYPMLDDMRKHGLKYGLIANFMYARAVKLPLLPFMIGLFGLTFTVIVNVYILIFAILQGKVIDFLMKNEKEILKNDD